MSNIKYEILSLETFINTVKHIAAGEIGKELAYFTIYKNFSVIETLSNNNNTINIEIDKHQEGFTILSYNNSLYVTSVKDLSMKNY